MKRILVLVVILLMFINGCTRLPKTASSPSPDPSPMANHSHHHAEQSPNDFLQFSSRSHAVSQVSDKGLYKLSLYSNEAPIPLQKIHSWTLHVENIQGAEIDKLKLFVFGGMPMHRHGFPTKPLISQHLGNGDFRIDGIKFNMAGHWELRFNITEKGQAPNQSRNDRAVFKVHLK